MDSGRIVLHYPNMKRTIPTYALYGETDSRDDWLHWETIQSRSRLHEYRIAPHRHEQFFQILALSGGSGEATLDGTAFNLSPGAVVLVPPVTVHGYGFSRDVAGVVVTMMERDVASLGLDVPAAQVIRSSAAIEEALGGLIAEADNPGPGHDIAMRARLSLLLVALGRAQHHAGPGDEAVDRARLHAQAFRQLVDRQFRQTRRIGDYAREIGISQTHLNRVCRDVLGASALEVIERRLALEARRQLMFSTLSIKQIGAELGYDDPAYFTRFVTRRLGEAPGAFRRRARG